MFECELSFDDELRRFLYPRLKSVDGSARIRRPNDNTPVKDLIESCGIPHPLVDAIKAPHQWVDFNYVPSAESLLMVFGVWKRHVRRKTECSLQRRVFKTWRFVLDSHLGKLARSLRLLGIDTWHQGEVHDDRLIEIMLEEDRILVTRDRQLLMRRSVNDGYFPLSDQPEEQLLEIIQRFEFLDTSQSFTRCLKCNGKLKKVDKDEIREVLEPLTKIYYQHFTQCDHCQAVYWEGSHFAKLQNTIEKIRR